MSAKNEPRIRPDFPFYRDHPQHVSGWRWTLIVLAVFAGFVWVTIPKSDSLVISIWSGAIVFVGLPLLTYALLVRPSWRVIFRRVRGIDVLMMFGFAALNLAVSYLIAQLVSAMIGANPNPVGSAMGETGILGRVLFFPGSALSLFGEELFSILLFLPLLQLFVSGWKVPRGLSITLTTLIVAVIFGLAHLPTYDWNVLQVLLIISVARIVLLLPWLITKNIWVCTGAHIINDWIGFLFIAVLTPLPFLS